MKEQVEKFKEDKRKLEQQIGELLRKFEIENGVVGSIEGYLDIVRNPARHTIEDPNAVGFIARVKIDCKL